MGAFKAFRIAPVALLILLTPEIASGEDSAPCLSLNSNLAVCTNVPGLSVSLVDATRTKVLGIVRIDSQNDFSFVFSVDWDSSTSLEDFTLSQMQELDPSLIWQGPMPITVRGLPAIQYEGSPVSHGDQGLGSKSATFIDTRAGIASFIGTSTSPDVTQEELSDGAERAADILLIRK